MCRTVRFGVCSLWSRFLSFHQRMCFCLRGLQMEWVRNRRKPLSPWLVSNNQLLVRCDLHCGNRRFCCCCLKSGNEHFYSWKITWKGRCWGSQIWQRGLRNHWIDTIGDSVVLDNCREALKGPFKIDFPLTLCAFAECSEKLWRRKKKSQLQHILAFLPASQSLSLSPSLSPRNDYVSVYAGDKFFSQPLWCRRGNQTLVFCSTRSIIWRPRSYRKTIGPCPTALGENFRWVGLQDRW